MALLVYNTATRKKEEFQSLTPGEVKMYVCGPTVYDFLHIGNFRGAVFFNLVRNWLEKKGYKVTYVYNYTDVDDKIIERANERGIDSVALSNQYIGEFEKDFNSLGLKKHSHNPRVSEFIPQIISITEKLVQNGSAYNVNGDVFYSIESFKPYGSFSGKTLEELQVGHRVEVNSVKKNPMDFSLWKPAKPGEPKWSSPWGEGRPGWHIECSAMASSLLGESIDIHGGGIDLIFPHHENEIAQSEGASHKKFAKYWMHNNFINVSGQKMSKSLGNFVTLRKFVEIYNAEIYKYIILAAHYRTQSEFGDSQIEFAVSGLARVYSSLNLAEYVVAEAKRVGLVAAALEEKYKLELQKVSEKIATALDDDFNTPEVFAAIFELVRSFNNSYKRGMKITPALLAWAEAFLKFVRETGGMMALYQEPPEKFLTVLDDMLLAQKKLVRADIDRLVQERWNAKQAKDFAKADLLRDQLVAMGISVQDTALGASWEVQK